MSQARRKARLWIPALLVLTAGAFILYGSSHYRLSPPKLITQVARAAATPVFALALRGDREWVERKSGSYWHGVPPGVEQHALPAASPFIFEDPDAPFLQDLRTTYALEELISQSTSEYDAILRLGGWVGSQFDHGTDPVAGGDKACDPVALVEAGREGSKYWCEIAARLMVHAAASVGLPARIITASTDGYTWEHAVAEIWSNEFSKWFVVDPDFNQVYELEGVPLSAIEILLRGEEWEQQGRLHRRQIAPPKASIPPGDPLGLYQYVHVDMRTDWCSRSLRRGSPAGGDLSTWWYARKDLRDHILTSSQFQPDPGSFDWKLNLVTAVPTGTQGQGGAQYAMVSYSPYFESFEVDYGNGWENAGARLSLDPGQQARVRVVTRYGWRGPGAAFPPQSTASPGASATN
jgi:hypothetical protein